MTESRARREGLRNAERLFRSGRYDEARERYRALSKAHPSWSYAEHALMMIGLCHDRMGRLDRAIRSYERAVREHPALRGFSQVTWYYLGEAYSRTGERARAISAVATCLALEKEDRRTGEFPRKEARRLWARLTRP